MFSFGQPNPPSSGPSAPAKRSPLSYAVEAGQVASVQALLKAGAPPNALDWMGRTAAHYLSSHDCAESDGRARLAGQGAAFPQVGRAAEEPSPEEPSPNSNALAIIAALAASGADFNIEDAHGFSPLARLVESAPPTGPGQLAEPVLRALLAAGARADCRLGLDEGNNSAPKPSVLKKLMGKVRGLDTFFGGFAGSSAGGLGGPGAEAAEEASVRTLLEFGATCTCSSGEDLFAEAMGKRRYTLARLLLSKESPQPTLQAVLDRARPRASQGTGGAFGQAANPFGQPPTPFGQAAHAFGQPPAAFGQAPQAVNNANLPTPAGPPPFSQEDLLTCCRLNHVEGIRTLLDPNLTPPLDINHVPGGGGSALPPLCIAVSNDCVEAMTLLLVGSPSFFFRLGAALAGSPCAQLTLLPPLPSPSPRQDLGAAEPERALTCALESSSTGCLTAYLARPGFDVNAAITRTTTRGSGFGGGAQDTITTTCTALELAGGSLAAVRLLTAIPGINLEQRDARGDTPLLAAISAQKLDVVEHLLSLGANVNASTRPPAPTAPAAQSSGFGSSPLQQQLPGASSAEDGCSEASSEAAHTYPALHVAARLHWEMGVGCLLERGAEVGALDSQGFTALCWAANYGDLSIAAMLLGKGADPNLATPFGAPRAVTPLYRAANGGHTAVLRALAAAGAKVDAVSGTLKVWAGASPLMAACRKVRVEAVKALCELGADVNHVLPSQAGAQQLRQAEMVREKQQQQQQQQAPFGSGGSFGSPGRSDDTYYEGQSALAIAAMNCTVTLGTNAEGLTHSEEIIATLVAHKARLDVQDCNGQTPLAHAAKVSSPLGAVAVKQLLALGASATILDAEGFSPLHHACKLLHSESGCLLCEKGGARADAAASPPGVPSPLLLVARAGARALGMSYFSSFNGFATAGGSRGSDAQDLVQALVKAGGDVLEKEAEGAGALGAASDGAGAVPAASPFGGLFARTVSGPTDAHKSPRGLASIALAGGKGNKDIARKLVELGAPVTDVFTAAFLGLPEPLAALKLAGEDLEGRTDGKTPLMWAAKLGNSECLRALLALGASTTAEESTLLPLPSAPAARGSGGGFTFGQAQPTAAFGGFGQPFGQIVLPAPFVFGRR